MAHLTDLGFGMDELGEAIANGDVRAQWHPEFPELSIYNYGEEVQYRNKWNRVTLACRGLILNNQTGEVVARPWEKFFNLGQVNLPIQFTDPVEVMDKADGSLGILYPTDDGYAIATRGSFESHQAIHATNLWNEKYSALAPDRRYTFLFEIVFPKNRIVLNYGDMDDLILLGAVENATGYYLGPNEAQAMLGWTGPVVEVFEYNTISDALAHMGRSNAEGYVIRSHNFLVKVKEPDYVELHKLVTNASPKTVWEQLKSGKSKTEVISAFPDEFHDYIGGMIDPLLDAYENTIEDVLREYRKVYSKIPAFASRKDFALAFKGHKYAKYFFLLLDNRPIRDVVWASLKPRETAIESVATRKEQA